MKLYHILVVFVIISCSTGKKCPDVLSEINHMEGYAQLHLPLSVDVDNFESYVDSKLPDTIYTDENAGGQGVALEVLKTGRPSIQLNGRTASIVLPLSIKADRDLGFLKAKADGQLFLTINSIIDVQSDWTLVTKSTVEKVEWVKEPKLKMAGLSLSVKGMVEKMIFSADNALADQLDAMIGEEQPLVKMIEGLTPQFNRSYPLDPEGQYFLQIVPEEAGIASFVESNESISTQVRLEAKAYMLKDSSSTREVNTSPVFDWADNKIAPYDLSTHLSIEESEIEDLMREAVIGETFIFRKKRVTLDQLYFDLQEKKIKVDAHMSGGIKGVIHFEGIPLWNERKGEIEFCNQEVDIQLQYGVSKMMVWLFKSQIENILAKKLREGVNDEIDKRIEEINSYLRDFKPSEKVSLNAEVYEHAIDPILVDNRRLKIGLNLNVRGKVNFDGLQLDIE